MQLYTGTLPQIPLSTEPAAHMADRPYKIAAALAALLVLCTMGF